MKKQISVLLAVIMVLTMMTAMCGCGFNKVEAAEIFSGEMVDAQNDRIVVRGEDETMLFVTTDETEYILQEEKDLCIGDTIEVDYHKGDGMYVADNVRLTAHVKHQTVFGGEVTELKKSYLTVQSESLTAVFIHDENTKVEGDLSRGDAVTVTYEGNLTENPRAVSIVVIQEKKEKTEKSLHGTVAEIGEKSVVISVDSAHACRIQITSDTTFGGDDTKLKIGDEVYVVYTGSAEDDSVAKSISIKRKQDQIYYVMDGVIDQVSSNGIVIRTSQDAYTFGIVKETRIQNRNYMKTGHKTTITYVGELDKNPVAASVFCSKDTVTEKEKQKSSVVAQSTEEEKNSKTKDSETKADQAARTKDDSKSDQTANTKKDAKSNQADKTKEDAKASQADTIKEDTKADKDDKAKDGKKADDADVVRETSAVDDAAETEKSAEDSQATKGSDDAPKTDSVIIKAGGEIISWNNPCIIKVEGSGTLNLDITDALVSGGYIPQAEDQVIVSYDKDSMKLMSIQLQYRPVKEDPLSQAIQDKDTQDTVSK